MGEWGQDLQQKRWRFRFILLCAHCALGVLVPVKAALSLSTVACLAAALTFICRFWDAGSCMAAKPFPLPSQM